MQTDPLCSTCLHFWEKDETGTKCDAYPDGIPTEIVFWEVDHRLPYKGDHGIQYKKEEE